MKRLLVLALLIVPFFNVVAMEGGGAPNPADDATVKAFDAYASGDTNSVAVLLTRAESYKSMILQLRTQLEQQIAEDQSKIDGLAKRLGDAQKKADEDITKLRDDLNQSQLSDEEKARQLERLQKELDDMRAAKDKVDELKKELDALLDQLRAELDEKGTLNQELLGKIAKLEADLREAQATYDKEKDEYENKAARLEEALQTSTQKGEDLTGKVERLEQVIETLNRKIAASQNDLTTRLAQLQENPTA